MQLDYWSGSACEVAMSSSMLCQSLCLVDTVTRKLLLSEHLYVTSTRIISSFKKVESGYG